METNKLKVLLGCTGSVAACRVASIAHSLKKRLNAVVRIVPTEHALFFLNSNDHRHAIAECGAEILVDADEWKWQKMGDPVLHIELRKWADVIVIAPLDANTLAKIANGIADNLLTSILRAWDIENKPVLFALAMNSFMMSHPVTVEHVAKLQSWNFVEIPCVEKTLACGDFGPGGIADTDTVVSMVENVLKWSK